MTVRNPKLHPTVWALGFVSLFMDISSEIVHSLLPLFLVNVIGAGVSTVGLIEGVAEATAMIVRVFSGSLSDWLGKRKMLAVIGYGLGSLSKPLFALASSTPLVVAARWIDRVGKGVRGAPRDALVADVTPPDQRGAAYGLRQSLDSIGSFLGPLLAMGLMLATSGEYRVVFWIACLPGALAVILLLTRVREVTPAQPRRFVFPLSLRFMVQLGSAYWIVVIIGSIFTLARFSEAFLLLRADRVGLSEAFVPIILVAMNIAYSLTAYPAGILSDRIGRYGLLCCGMLVLIVADLVLALASTPVPVFAGALFWGIHMGLTQGLIAAYVADTLPSELRGTGFGIFGLTSGVSLLFASLLAGWLWEAVSPAATFWGGATLAGGALIILIWSADRLRAATFRR